MKHYDITVKGKVQGVWYRKSTLEKAQQLGINGIVKNLPNGNVYIEAEGQQDQLQLFLKWCAKGPEYAVVDEVSKTETEILAYEDFQIRY
ncbi:acylphosphatase [Aquimarina litoralis]|nr:acylphosphatase [Aquimarina litoralis]